MSSKSLPEVWKPIRGYELRYEVSNWGRIRSWLTTGFSKKLRKTPKILMKSLHRGGYEKVGLVKDHYVKTISVHRLVALAFLGEDDVREIRKRHAEGESRTAIARSFGVHQGTVHDVCNRT